MIRSERCEHKCFVVLQHCENGVHDAPGLTSSSEKKKPRKGQTLNLPSFVKENLLNVEDLQIWEVRTSSTAEVSKVPINVLIYFVH